MWGVGSFTACLLDIFSEFKKPLHPINADGDRYCVGTLSTVIHIPVSF